LIGGGMGNGRGTGFGNGRGTGNGNGIGSGNGNGIGDGDGDGTGDGTGGNTPPPIKPKAPAVTEKIKILSKPKPGYTDAARTAQVQGVVRLKVTFLASGQVGGVSVISGLPNGLTEKAIAAAKSISFVPAKKDGVPYTVSSTIEYSFAIY
jgi:periplasmic protein TonB